MGDAMVQWTGGVLRSNVHRVTCPPKSQEDYDRFSIAYLIRASSDVTMKRLRGGRIPDEGSDGDCESEDMLAGEWEKTKNLALISGKIVQRVLAESPWKKSGWLSLWRNPDM
jgi:isopenicillin N synthase-like dioxygenase